jgi:hypothetical protein
MIGGEACPIVGEVCIDNGRTCTCEMGRGGGSSWDCAPIGRDGGGIGGFGGRDGGGRDVGGFGGFGGFGGRDGGGRRGDGG